MNQPVPRVPLDPAPIPFAGPAPGTSPVHEAIARALARLTEPDLSGFDDDQVSAALAEAYGASVHANPGYLAWLAGRIRTLSGGMTWLEEADPAEFPFLSKDFSATYYRLVGLFVQRLVILERSNPPFMIVR
jgi:hypothetical protein